MIVYLCDAQDFRDGVRLTSLDVDTESEAKFLVELCRKNGMDVIIEIRAEEG